MSIQQSMNSDNSMRYIKIVQYTCEFFHRYDDPLKMHEMIYPEAAYIVRDWGRKIFLLCGSSS